MRKVYKAIICKSDKFGRQKRKKGDLLFTEYDASNIYERAKKQYGLERREIILKKIY